MHDPIRPSHELLGSLRERAKELNCLYEVEEHLASSDRPVEEVFDTVIGIICAGWQFPEVCRARITYEGRAFGATDITPTPWSIAADIVVHDHTVGELRVFYTEQRPTEAVGPFLREEVRLINTIAQRLGHFILYQRIKDVRADWLVRPGEGSQRPTDWRGALHLLRESDKTLYLRIARKMLNHLVSIGHDEAWSILPTNGSPDPEEDLSGESNVPGRRRSPDNSVLLSDQPFQMAERYLSSAEILLRVQKWMQEDKASAFIKVINNPRTSLPEIADAFRRHQHILADKSILPASTQASLRVTLTQRLLTEQVDFVRTAKSYVEATDFLDLLQHMILPAESHGRLGGKSAGLFLAYKVLMRTLSPERPIGEVKTPKTWYIASDGLMDFVAHNDLEDVVEQKFKETDQIRQEYPNVIQLFKNSSFAPRVVTGISVALDDLGDCPLIVRSSSLLEDRLGTAFSGKYKSLFLANQGTKQQRMDALLDAIAEVYASVFGPDPIEYRRKRNLLEFNEEMGVLIQEVVGTRVGKYYLPAFAGVAFSNNEFRWSPRIKREDGLIRLVPGLGTRAVDRVGDDYPILAVPGQPNLRANVALDEIVRYAPRMIDVINLETNTLETLTIHDLLLECGTAYPAFERIFSVLRGDMLQKSSRLMSDPEKDDLVPTFNGLIGDTPFIQHLGNIMKILQEHLGTPIDIEFAHDGKDFYLLQCRPQSNADDATPAPIPREVPAGDVLFSADRHISNGYVPDITHIVYVDPVGYGELADRNDMLAVGRAVGKLNAMLPKRQFILMGPGRWGSRGDIKLGVSVTYADISNTAMLIEIARLRGGYVPDLSFGTHFFQDLVESRIRYLPLYPDEPKVIFNERFFLSAPNLLAEMLPEHADLAPVLRVIDVAAVAEGRVLQVLLNSDLNEGLGLLAPAGARGEQPLGTDGGVRHTPLQYWRWRQDMADRIAAEIDPARFGVIAMYIFGSVKNGTAGPGSDIDLLIHVRGTDEQRRDLLNWLQGWSLCLGEINYLRTGYRTNELLDVHLVTDEDIAKKTSYAVKIGAITDAAREIPLKQTG
jgi:predicted nucleotidyltransferase